MANVFLVTFQLTLGPLLNLGQLIKFLLFSVSLWFAVTLWTNRAPLRLPAGMILVALLQVVFTITTMYADAVFTRSRPFMATNYFMTAHLLAFLLGSSLVYFAPQSRVYLARAFVAFAVVSATVAYLQFANVGAAIELGNVYVQVQAIDNWQGQGGVRAIGLWGGLGQAAIGNVAAAALIASALAHRKLSWIEVVLIAYLVCAAVLTQARSFYPTLLLLGLVLLVLVVRRHKLQSVPLIALGIALMGAVLWFGRDNLTYITSYFDGSNRGTWESRTGVLWQQAYQIYHQHPWTGIGAEPAFAGQPTLFADKYVEEPMIDNGYLLALAYGGLPAIALMILFAGVSVITSWAWARVPKDDPMHTAFCWSTAAIALSWAINMLVGNMITNIHSYMVLFVFAGFALSSKVAPPRRQFVIPEIRRKLHASRALPPRRIEPGAS